VGVSESLPHLDNGIRVSIFGCVLLDCGLWYKLPVVWTLKGND